MSARFAHTGYPYSQNISLYGAGAQRAEAFAVETGIGWTPPIVVAGYAADDAFGLPAPTAGEAMLRVAATLPGGLAANDNFFPLRITLDQWHFFNFVVKKLRIDNVPHDYPVDECFRHQNDILNPPANVLEDAYYTPEDEDDLMFYPGANIVETSADNPGFAFLLGIGSPVPSSGFNKASMAQEIEDDRLASTIYPFWKTWPVTMLNYVAHSSQQYPNIYTTGLASALFYGGAVWPFIELRVGFIDGLGRTGTLATNNAFGANAEGADAPSAEDSGLTLTLFDWGSVPLYNITDSTYPARTDELPGNITITAAECYTYGGTRHHVTGALL